MCLKNLDSFCHIVGEFTFTSQRRKFTTVMEKCYLDYCGLAMHHPDKPWVPYKCCISCMPLWVGWVKGLRYLSFSPPIIWTEWKGHVSNCFFYLIHRKDITNKSKHINDPNLSSAIGPILSRPVTKPSRPPESLEFVFGANDNVSTERDQLMNSLLQKNLTLNYIITKNLPWNDSLISFNIFRKITNN